MNTHIWGNIAYVIMSVGLLLMSVLFLGFTRWWRDSVGRSIAAFFGSTGLILAFGISVVAGLMDIGTPFFEWARIVLYGFLAISVWALVIGFIIVQMVRPRARKTSRTPTSGGTVE